MSNLWKASFLISNSSLFQKANVSLLLRGTQQWTHSKNAINSQRIAWFSSEVKVHTIDVHFRDGFFNFKLDDKKYVISFWTPLSELLSNLESHDDSKKKSHTLIDVKSGDVLPQNTMFGDIAVDKDNSILKLEHFGQLRFHLKCDDSEVISWKMYHKKIHECHEDLQTLEKQKESLLSKYTPMDSLFHKIVNDARSHSRLKFKWGGLFLLSAQLGFVARLTWFEYSWDIMEPITWCLTYSMMIATFAYYNLTSQEYLLPEVERRILKNRFFQIAAKRKFDVNEFKRLQNTIKSLDQRIFELKSGRISH